MCELKMNSLLACDCFREIRRYLCLLCYMVMRAHSILYSICLLCVYQLHIFLWEVCPVQRKVSQKSTCLHSYRIILVSNHFYAFDQIFDDLTSFLSLLGVNWDISIDLNIDRVKKRYRKKAKMQKKMLTWPFLFSLKQNGYFCWISSCEF